MRCPICDHELDTLIHLPEDDEFPGAVYFCNTDSHYIKYAIRVDYEIIWELIDNHLFTSSQPFDSNYDFGYGYISIRDFFDNYLSAHLRERLARIFPEYEL